MKILLDECIDWRFAREISGHDVKTARQMGWLTVKKGELLALAGQEFDAFVTVDRNLAFQQNTRALPIAVVVLCAPTNRLGDLKRLVPELLGAVSMLKSGAVTFIGQTE